MKAKKDLLEKCKELVEQVKQTEHEVALRLRKISGDVSAQLEAERRSFRAGQESRQRKVRGVGCTRSGNCFISLVLLLLFCGFSSWQINCASARKRLCAPCSLSSAACVCQQSRTWPTWQPNKRRTHDVQWPI